MFLLCMSHVHAFSCIRTLHSINLCIFELFGTFLSVSFFPSHSLVYVSASMAPKRKSTQSQNPLRSGASSSFDPTSSAIRFHDEDTRKDFSENFSRRGVHSERQVVLADFVDTDLPDVIHSRG